MTRSTASTPNPTPRISPINPAPTALLAVTVRMGACTTYPAGTELRINARSTCDALLSILDSFAPNWATARLEFPTAGRP